MKSAYKYKKLRTCFGAFLVTAASSLCASTQATPWEVFTELDSLTYSENFTIYGLLDSLEGSTFTAGGDSSFTHNQAVIGLRKGAWEFGVFNRYDYVVEYTADTAFIAFSGVNDIPVPNGDFDINIRFNRSQSHGVRLGYTHDVTDDLAVKFRLSGLAAREIVDGSITGIINSSDGEISSPGVQVDYRLTNDILFLREIEDPTGYGASLDIIVNWQASDKLALEFAAYDALNRIWWKDLTRSVADATTAISRTADNGVLIVRPTLQGQNLFEDYQQRLRTRLDFRGTYAVSNRWGLSQELFKTGDNYLAQTGANYKISPQTRLGATYEWVSGAVGFDIKWHRLQFELATDSFQWKEARYVKAQIGFVHKF